MVKKGRKSSSYPMGAINETRPRTVCEHKAGDGANTMTGSPQSTSSHKFHKEGTRAGPKHEYRPTSWKRPRCSWTWNKGEKNNNKQKKQERRCIEEECWKSGSMPKGRCLKKKKREQ